jgi:quinol monooxygenase YgiN
VVEKVKALEPDTLAYIVHGVPSAPMQRILYEVYRDEAAFEEHGRQPYIQEFEEERKPYILATNVIELGVRQAKLSPLGGPAGPPAPAGHRAQPGAPGRPSQPGQPSRQDQPAMQGPPGMQGRPAQPGRPPRVDRPGKPGRPSQPGQSAIQGRPSQQGRPSPPDQAARQRSYDSQ